MPRGRPPHPQREEVIQWMQETGRGYRAAARHFDLPRDTVKRWGRIAKGIIQESPGQQPAAPARAPAPARTPEPPPEPEEPSGPPEHELSEVEFWARRLQVAGEASRAALARSHTNAAASWEKIAHKARQQLDAARAANPGTDLASLSAKRYRLEMTKALRKWTDVDLELALGVYAERHKAALRMVSADGKVAEYDAKERCWRQLQTASNRAPLG